MRPLRLTMQAFGPYANREEIDFRRLGGKSFFLIHGPTGGGKTTILDAMCYALYGDTSGDIRNGKEMRSDFADPATPTEILFDFSLGGACYRVRRSPEQERPRKRGDGTTTQRPEATLWKLEKGSDSSLEEAGVLETHSSKVTARIGDLLGFRSEQFRQVIMLPQGRFEELLLAGSKDREAILEILFQTEFYSRIEEALKAAAREITDEMQKLRQRRAIMLEQAEATDGKELDRLLHGLETELERAERNLERLSEKERRTQERLQAGRDLEERFREREEAAKELGRFTEAEQGIRKKKDRLKLARKAAGIAALEETAEDRRAAVRELESDLEEARRTKEEAEHLRKEATRALALEKRREGRRRRANKQVIRLEGLVGRMAELEEARGRLEDARKLLETTGGEVEELRDSVKKTVKGIETLEKDIKRARDKADAVPALRLRLEQARIVLQQRRKLESLKGNLREERKSLRDFEKQMIQAGKRFDKARRALMNLEKAWRESQAGILAKTLRPGAACPVCGSTEHPHPAHLPSDVPDHHRLGEHRARVEAMDKEREQARDAHAGNQRDFSRLEADVHSLSEGLGDNSGRTLGSVVSEVRKLERDLEKAEAGTREAEAATTDLERMRKLEAEALKELTAREAVLKQAEKAFEGALAVVRERERELPRNIRSRIQLEEALTRARNDHKDLLDALEAAREREADARRAYAEAKAAEGGVRKSLRAATTEAGKAEAKFAGRIKSAGFSDTNHYREARLEDLEIERLAEEIDNHVAGLKAARMRLTRARQSTRRRKRPDLSRLERKAEKAKSKCDEMIARTAGIRKEYKRLADLGKEVGLAERKLKRLDKRYCVAGKIADVANGKNPQGITFQRFVLAALLDDVLSAATDRLKVMSRGRFDLNRAGERGDRRSAGGLDLEVYDSYTGTARPVSTLSGGETFLAALSLALGLADVVQAYAGGIRMETIFVDEGFGSLDPESLDLAVRALMDLQRGNRLVGIISHVPELKERIDVRLEVRTTRRGSSARFVGI